MNIIRITKSDRTWYEIVLWWEIRRIPYNVAMYFLGLGSFYVAYVTIPLFYLIIGLALNVGYSFCWIVELTLIKPASDATKLKYPGRAFLSYLSFSTLAVFGFALLLLLSRPDYKI